MRRIAQPPLSAPRCNWASRRHSSTGVPPAHRRPALSLLHARAARAQRDLAYTTLSVKQIALAWVSATPATSHASSSAFQVARPQWRGQAYAARADPVHQAGRGGQV